MSRAAVNILGLYSLLGTCSLHFLWSHWGTIFHISSIVICAVWKSKADCGRMCLCFRDETKTREGEETMDLVYEVMYRILATAFLTSGVYCWTTMNIPRRQGAGGYMLGPKPPTRFSQMQARNLLYTKSIVLYLPLSPPPTLSLPLSQLSCPVPTSPRPSPPS